MENTSENKTTTNWLDFYTFFTAKSSKFEKYEENEEISHEISTTIAKARAVLASNPFHKEPVGYVESIEDILAIKNRNEIRDQLM